MLPLPLAFALERAIEFGLALDPDTRERLAALDGKVLRFCVESPSLELVLIVVDGRVKVPARHDGEADATISGSLAALRSLARSNDALYRGDVSIAGDVGVGRALRAVVTGLDPDWESVLSPVLGDALVHRLGRLARGAGRWWSRSRGSLAANTRDWLEDEVELVAAPLEVERFAREVDALRAATDRFEARLALFERDAAVKRSVDAAPGAGVGR